MYSRDDKQSGTTTLQLDIDTGKRRIADSVCWREAGPAFTPAAVALVVSAGSQAIVYDRHTASAGQTGTSDQTD